MTTGFGPASLLCGELHHNHLHLRFAHLPPLRTCPTRRRRRRRHPRTSLAVVAVPSPSVTLSPLQNTSRFFIISVPCRSLPARLCIKPSASTQLLHRLLDFEGDIRHELRRGRSRPTLGFHFHVPLHITIPRDDLYTYMRSAPAPLAYNSTHPHNFLLDTLLS